MRHIFDTKRSDLLRAGKANKGRLAWKVINDSTTLGPTLVIGPEVQPSNPDVFAAPPICYVTIPYPPPRHLHIDVGGHHNFKTRICEHTISNIACSYYLLTLSCRRCG